MRPTAVRKKAGELGIDVLPAPNVNAASVLARIEAAAPDVIVVVSFGQMLRRTLLEIAPLGCVNLHFSLLPALRGAAPVAWAIIGGLDETGVSIMKIVPRMDAGPVYAQETEPVRPDDTSETLSVRLGRTGALLLVETLPAIARGEIEPTPQDESAATFAPRIQTADGAIDWNMTAREVDRLIRGLSGRTAAFAFLDREPPLRVNFYNSRAIDAATAGPGLAARSPEGGLVVGCGRGLVEIREIQAQGKRRITGREFANGYHISAGERFLGGNRAPRDNS